ncbi:MAG TPA: hypothetical protein VND65_17050 [Candidatus Binatia bacterium]|nr:hypothetical protein [Candidatus Binatia bacterium]
MPRSMSKMLLLPIALLGVSFAGGQDKRIWVLRAPGEMVEYDAATFAQKLMVKVPAEALGSPQNLSVNRAGQILFAEPVSLPLAEGDAASARKIWFWDGHAATALTRNVARTTATTGSNLAISETAPVPYLSEDGAHLYWFQNQARRLQRDGVDLSTKTTWSAWRTDLHGEERQDLASVILPECSCPTGGCEESCPYAQIWAPAAGIGKYFLVTQFIAGKTQPVYQSSSVYEESGAKWNAVPVNPPLRRVFDAAGANAILEAIPDTSCCGWSNQSNDQTILRQGGKTVTVFDEFAEYKNPDYDVSFYTDNGQISPDTSAVAFTVRATGEPNKPIQLAEQGQANPEESQRIRKALLDLPAVEIKSVDDASKRMAFLPHATLVGWISEKEILIVEGHVLTTYNVTNATRRKSAIRAEDAAHVFLR